MSTGGDRGLQLRVGGGEDRRWDEDVRQDLNRGANRALEQDIISSRLPLAVSRFKIDRFPGVRDHSETFSRSGAALRGFFAFLVDLVNGLYGWVYSTRHRERGGKNRESARERQGHRE